MAKYFITWEVDPNRAPVDPKERGAAWLMMAEMVKKDIQEVMVMVNVKKEIYINNFVQ